MINFLLLVLILSVLESQENVHTDELPKCMFGNNVCAKLQKNFQGTYLQQLCICEDEVCVKMLKNTNRTIAEPLCSRQTCSTSWRSDSHSKSATQGDNQYQFCSDIRNEFTKTCTVNQNAYKEATITTIATNKKEILHHYYCYCPPEFKYVYSTTNRVVNDTHKVESKFFKCEAIPSCNGDEVCKIAVERTNSYTVSKHCLCYNDKICPDDPKEAFSNKTQNDGSTYYEFKCPDLTICIE
uniref:U-scoloptoxin(11)-Sm3a n=1 Tax=Scolopendra morsitans TaxID=943129 RepID=TXB3A_SCOMO|nr:RecName: Full=U-scoloptoxin(11)-Sm3a; Short=U-SLPTX(11)-Sm3a; Flags: Precursor [Scolopendra morsitans]